MNNLQITDDEFINFCKQANLQEINHDSNIPEHDEIPYINNLFNHLSLQPKQNSNQLNNQNLDHNQQNNQQTQQSQILNPPILPYETQLILFVLPFTLPGSGKEKIRDHLQEICKQNQILFHSISSEEICRNMVEELQKGNQEMTQDQCFNICKKDGRTMFSQSISDSVDIALQSRKKTVIFIEKNTFANNIQCTLDSIKTLIPSPRIIGIVPRIEKEVQIDYSTKFPLSMALIIFSLTNFMEKQALSDEHHQKSFKRFLWMLLNLENMELSIKGINDLFASQNEDIKMEGLIKCSYHKNENYVNQEMENGLLKGLTDLIVTHRKGRNLKAKIQGFVEKTCKVIKNRRIEWANEIEQKQDLQQIVGYFE